MSTDSEWLDLSEQEFLSRWYREQYSQQTYSGVAGGIQRWMHRSIERGYSRETRFDAVLEVGGNRGEHLSYVQHSFGSYILSDVRPPLEGLLHLPTPPGVEFQVVDVQSMPFRDGEFDRVLNTCLLHHVPDPELALNEMRRVLRPGGTTDIFLSGDPGALFRLGRSLGPIRRANLQGLKRVKRLVDARDHRNHCGGLRRLIQHVFRHDHVEVRSYPFGLPGWNGSLWLTYRVTKSQQSADNGVYS